MVAVEGHHPENNIGAALCMMLVSAVFVVIVRSFGHPTWKLGHAPHEEHPWIRHLTMIQDIWKYQMTFTTFILTFYVNQAYSFFQETHVTMRTIQGRINDFMLLLATCAKRDMEGSFTAEARALMEDVGSSSRLMHAFFWASVARCFKPLTSPMGLERMAQRGLMTHKQLSVLQSLDASAGDQWTACLEWMMIRTLQGVQDDVFLSSGALTRELLEQICILRSSCAKVADDLGFRMPLAYTHFVQILVDTFVIFSPMALYPGMGVYCILCVGIITLFYTRLMDLAKIFLDPLDNQNFTKNSVNMGMDLGVLTRESNAFSTQFAATAALLPFDQSKSNCRAAVPT
jgi:Bestrophin, RFP-TM, chloride channel